MWIGNHWWHKFPWCGLFMLWNTIWLLHYMYLNINILYYVLLLKSRLLLTKPLTHPLSLNSPLETSMEDTINSFLVGWVLGVNTSMAQRYMYIFFMELHFMNTCNLVIFLLCFATQYIVILKNSDYIFFNKVLSYTIYALSEI